LQVHFAIVMVASGLHKLQFGDWWAGLALWFPLHPPMQLTPASVGSPTQVASSLTWLSLCAYALLAWQIAFPAFAWRPRWRWLLVGGALVGWLGCALIYRMPVFGPALVVSCLSFVTPQEWRRFWSLLGRVPGLERVADQGSVPEPLVPQATK
jgi:hypothetical protein